MPGIGERRPHAAQAGAGSGSPRANRTVPGLLAWRRHHHPTQVAIEVAGVDALTFERWDSESSAVAKALQRKGVKRGEAVGLVFGSRDWTAFAIAYCGVQKAGAVAVPMHDNLPPARIGQLLQACEATRIIRAADMPELVAQAGGQDESRPPDLGQILFTSGTSGQPKGVTATHANLTASAPTHPKRLALAHSERFLHAYPIGTNAAQTMLMNALTAKPSALTLPQFTPRRFAQLLPGAGTVFLVPATAIELLEAGVLEGMDTTGIHLVGSTAAPLPPAVAIRLTQAFPQAAIVNYYTSTEAAPTQTSMIFDPARPDALGRPAPGTVRITDEAGAPAPDGHIGEVWLRSPHPRRYLRDDEASRATFRDGWVRMGDLGHLSDGYLYLCDRDSDVVKSGAHKVSTLEVESALYEHPAVSEAAVVGLTHRVLGKQLAVAIVLRPGAGDIGLPALRAFLAERLADHQLPNSLLLLDRLPRNDAGKVLKRQLIELFPAANGRNAR